MDERAKVIVVGAGVVGCSVAYHLARMGETDVLVLEREKLPGSGSTSRAMAAAKPPTTAWVRHV